MLQNVALLWAANPIVPVMDPSTVLLIGRVCLGVLVAGMLLAAAAVIIRHRLRVHYKNASDTLAERHATADADLQAIGITVGCPDPSQPVAAILASEDEGLCRHTFAKIFRPSQVHEFKGVIFVSVCTDPFQANRIRQILVRHVESAKNQGIPADYRLGIGADAVFETEELCRTISAEFPHASFFIGRIILGKTTTIPVFLRLETAFAIQRRLTRAGRPVGVLSAVVE